LFKKKVLFLLVYEKKKKSKFFVESSDLNGKTLLIWFFVYCQKQRALAFAKKKNRDFVLSFSEFFSLPQMKEEKNKQTRSKIFFLFVKTSILLYKTMKHFFVSQLSKKASIGLRKKETLFYCVRS
jgi:hypothetical protein